MTRFLHVIFGGVHTSGHLELAAIEMLIRSAMHQAGAAALTRLLQYAPPDAEHRTIACPCGQSAQYFELRSKSMLTVVGPVQLTRPYYFCPHCHKGQFPVDVQLGVAAMESSPGVRRMEAVVGSEAPFDQGREQMKLLADLEVTTKAIERSAEAIGADIAVREQPEIARAKQLVLPIVSRQSIPILYVVIDATGVPVVTKETEGRVGKIEGQRSHTRECKLGCVFTQTNVDAEGRPIRDPDSTTYTGAIETAEEFGFRIYTEAWRRGWEWARRKVVLGDGAVWIWNIADRHFPGAIQIVDLYHARQHLWNVAAMLYPYDPVAKNRWMIPMQDLLDNGKIELLVERLQEIAAGHASLAENIRKEADYFATNANRMRYPEFRKQGLFIGSGVIEAGCKTVIGERLKRSGMFWTVRGANAIIALRCCRFNVRFDDYCEEARIA